jgi:hypothetical protein
MSVATVLWRLLSTHSREPMDVSLTASCPFPCPVGHVELTMHVNPAERQPQTLHYPLCGREAQILAAKPLSA